MLTTKKFCQHDYWNECAGRTVCIEHKVLSSFENWTNFIYLSKDKSKTKGTDAIRQDIGEGTNSTNHCESNNARYANNEC